MCRGARGHCDDVEEMRSKENGSEMPPHAQRDAAVPSSVDRAPGSRPHAAHGAHCSLAVSSKTQPEDEPPDPAPPALAVNPREPSACPPRDLYEHVHSSFSCNCPKQNSPVSPPGGGIDESYSRILTMTKINSTAAWKNLTFLLSEEIRC